MSLISTGDAARAIGVPPKVISDFFYAGRLDAERCPIVGGRRLIPCDYLDVIRIELRRAGKLPRLMPHPPVAAL